MNQEKFHSYGWQTENILQKKIDECKLSAEGRPVVAVIGDSFVEFYGDTDKNLVKKLAVKMPDRVFCNFGVSGAGPAVYKNRLKEVLKSKAFQVDQTVVLLYEGNDYSDYLLSTVDDDGISDRKLSWMTNFVKGSYSINFVYREFFKRLFSKKKINPYELANNLNLRNVDLKVVDSIYENTPTATLDLFAADLLNVSWYSVALAMPDYFARVHSPSNDEFGMQKSVVMKDVMEMRDVSKEKLTFVVIPHDYFLFDQSKKEWAEVFRFNYDPRITGKTKMTKLLEQEVSRVYYSGEIFSYEDFIKNDGHLTDGGNIKLVSFISKTIQ